MGRESAEEKGEYRMAEEPIHLERRCFGPKAGDAENKDLIYRRGPEPFTGRAWRANNCSERKIKKENSDNDKDI
jgi:hypothetical protein